MMHVVDFVKAGLLFHVTISLISSVATVQALGIPDPFLHFGVGAVAGAAGAVAAYPFDYVKSQMQIERSLPSSNGSDERPEWNNGWEAGVDIIQKQGPLQLYKGVGVQVVGIAPEKGIKLGVNDVILANAFPAASLGGIPLWGQVISGGIAGACQVVASSPLEVLKVGLQTSDRSFLQVWEYVGGFRGLFRGAEACIARDVLFTAVCFPLYNYGIQSGLPAFVAGAMSGVIASFVATPPDVVKTRMLSQRDSTCTSINEQRGPTSSFLDATPSLSLAGSFDSAIGTRVFSNSTMGLIASDKPSTLSATTDPTTSTQQAFVVTAQSKNQNAWDVFCNILEKESPSVLFSGVTERCLGAIPRFGTTLAMHDILEQMMNQAGWLSHSAV